MPKETLAILKNTRVYDKKLNIEELSEKNNSTAPRESKSHFKREHSKRKGNGKPRSNRDKKFSRSRSRK
jgi:FtsZ-binding cell division protein ZapB